jgi:Ni/Co efflux regulator RcnB
MRRLWMAVAVMAGLSLATPAAAQRVWQNGRWVVMPHSQGRTQVPSHGTQSHGNRWGPVVDGRWDAGNRAPGGWSSYRRPVRGWTLPGYWRDSRFRVNDYLNFGLSAPPRGYYWVRYYDDAVLVDDGGRVWDSTGGIGWGASAEAYGDDYAWSEGSASVAVAGAGYPPPPRRPIESVDPNAYYREPGAYLTTEPGYDADPIPYPNSGYPAGGYAPPVVQGPPAVQVRTVQGPAYGYGAQGSYGATSYYGGGYAYGGGATTTVVVIPAVTTTTTTETYTTSYVSVAKRAVRRAPVRKWRPRPKPKCCVCVCR